MKYSGRYAGQKLPRRITFMLIAVVIMGFGVSLFVKGTMGADPFSTINLGISSKIGISFGAWQAIFNCILLVLVLILDRSMLGLGTIANMFIIGFVADVFGNMLTGVLPAADEMSIPIRLLLTLGGVAAQIIGCSFYVTSNLGMAPYDCISFIIPNKTKIPFRWWRIFTDLVCVAIGFFCGASIGLGTLIMAFGTGPLLPLCNKYIAAPILKIKDITK
jgi:uncharacterized membrane protein YczE